jgi:hypothetical protein
MSAGEETKMGWQVLCLVLHPYILYSRAAI